MNKLYVLNINKLTNKAFFDTAYESLSDARRMRIDKMRADKMRTDKAKEGQLFRSLAAGYLLNLGLKEIGINSVTEPFSAYANGKPCLPAHPEIHFNISHSFDYAICAFSDTNTGADIEKIRYVPENVVKKALCDTEYNECVDDAGNLISENFFKFWTRNESYLKMTGKGIAVDLKKVPELILSENPVPDFHVFNEIPGYIITICTCGIRPTLTEI